MIISLEMATISLLSIFVPVFLACLTSFIARKTGEKNIITVRKKTSSEVKAVRLTGP